MSLRDFGFGKKSVEERIQEESRAVVEVMDRAKGQGQSIKNLLAVFSSNIICSMIFGER